MTGNVCFALLAIVEIAGNVSCRESQRARAADEDSGMVLADAAPGSKSFDRGRKGVRISRVVIDTVTDLAHQLVQAIQRILRNPVGKTFGEVP